jgi:hypothetical protein
MVFNKAQQMDVRYPCNGRFIGMNLKPIEQETIQPYGSRKKYHYTLMGTSMEASIFHFMDGKRR